MIYQLTAIFILATFYVFYFAKNIIQKKQSIKTNQMGIGNKPAKVLLIERIMSCATVLAVVFEVGSIFLVKQFPAKETRVIGILIGIIGVIFFALATITMKTSWRVGIPEEKTSLITNGIYKWSRNPAFVGFDLLYLSMCFMFFNIPLVCVSVWAAVMLHLQILQEETHMYHMFGDEYLSYKKQTLRFFGKRKMKKRIFLGIILVCMMFVGLYIGHRTISVSKCDRNNLEYQKVMKHLEVISQEVHPSGTEEIERVRQYSLEVLDELECSYTKETFEARGYSSVSGSRNVEFSNILVAIDVPGTTDGVLMVSHYDSTPGGPGAADDGISVASMLVALEQSMNAYKAGTLKNDMYYLFTDGEELGMYGAAHFVNKHSDMQEYVKLVVNFEARGNKGSLLMFQTSSNNNRMLRQLKKAVSNLDAFSVAASLYETMPNDTDLTLFLDAGYTSCLNFAMIDGSETYHQNTDNFENISYDSAYRYYKTVTEIADYFGSSDLDTLIDDENAVFFPTIGGKVFVLSSSFANVSTILLTALLLLWIGILIWKKKIHGIELLKAFVLPVVSILVAFLFGKGYLHYIKSISETKETIAGAMDFLGKMNVAQAVLVCILVTFLTAIISKLVKSSQEHFLLAMIICAAGGIALMVLFDCLIYLFLIPLFLLLVQSVTVYFMQEHGKKTQGVNWFFAVIMIITMSVILYPLMKVIFDALGNDFMLYFALVEAFGVYMVNVCFMGNWKCRGTVSGDCKDT